jgi:hypothetical protein
MLFAQVLDMESKDELLGHWPQKTCNHYFDLTGRINEEYCDCPVDASGYTCKDMGVINL